MCFLSCSLDSPPAPQFLSWGHSLPGALGAGRLVLPSAPPSPFTPCTAGAALGGHRPCTPLPLGPHTHQHLIWENLPLAPEKSFGWETPAEHSAFQLLRSLPALPPPSLPRGPWAGGFSSPRCRHLPGEGSSPGAGGGTSVGPALISLLAALSPRCAE